MKDHNYIRFHRLENCNKLPQKEKNLIDLRRRIILDIPIGPIGKVGM